MISRRPSRRGIRRKGNRRRTEKKTGNKEAPSVYFFALLFLVTFPFAVLQFKCALRVGDLLGLLIYGQRGSRRAIALANLSSTVGAELGLTHRRARYHKSAEISGTSAGCKPDRDPLTRQIHCFDHPLRGLVVQYCLERPHSHLLQCVVRQSPPIQFFHRFY